MRVPSGWEVTGSAGRGPVTPGPVTPESVAVERGELRAATGEGWLVGTPRDKGTAGRAVGRVAVAPGRVEGDGPRAVPSGFPIPANTIARTAAPTSEHATMSPVGAFGCPLPPGGTGVTSVMPSPNHWFRTVSEVTFPTSRTEGRPATGSL